MKNASSQRERQVFISYNIADKVTATEIALFLTTESLNVWFDEWKISAGDSIVQQIESGLKDCSHFIILWSCNSSKSKWVRKELQSVLASAISNGYPKIIPIKLDNEPLPTLLADIRYISYHGGVEKDRNEIISAILGHAPSINLIKAVVKKYHELISNSDASNPFGLVACPKCGSDRLKGFSQVDPERDKLYNLIECKECGWNDWTQ